MSPVSGTRLQSLPLHSKEGQLLEQRKEHMWMPYILDFITHIYTFLYVCVCV